MNNEDYSNLYNMIVRIHNMHEKAGLDQDILVIEESGELLQELMKLRREKGNRDKACEEACDLLSTLLVYIWENASTADTFRYIYDQIMFKYQRALDRFYEKGEK